MVVGAWAEMKKRFSFSSTLFLLLFFLVFRWLGHTSEKGPNIKCAVLWLTVIYNLPLRLTSTTTFLPFF